MRARWNRRIRPAENDSLPFLDGEGLTCRDVREFLDLTAWPLDLDVFGLGVRAQSKRQHQFALREVARTRAQHLPLLVATGGQTNDRTDAIAIRSCANEFEAQAVIRPPFVMKQVGWPAIGGDNHIEEAVIVDVGISGRAGYFRSGKRLAHLSGDFRELSSPEIAEQVGRLGITDALLYALDLIFDVTVGDKNVGPAVVVVIEKEAAETEGHQRTAADFRLRRLVDKKTIALVVIERDHLVGEIADDNARAPAAIVVRGIDAHAGARHSVFTETDAGRDSTLLECTVAFVQIQLVGLGIVGDQNVGPAVTVVIENRDPQALRGRVGESGLLGSILKFASLQVVPEADRSSLVGLRRAIGFVRPVERAIEIALFAPLNVVGDQKIEFAVAVVVDPDGAGGELVRPPQTCGFGHIRERAVAVVMEQMALAERRNEDVVVAIIIVIPDRNSQPEHRDGQAGSSGNVGKGAVVIVVIKLQRRRAGVGMAGEVFAIRQQDVGISIVVVVKEGAPRSHSFRKPLLAEGTVVVREMNARLRGDVAELDLFLGMGSERNNENEDDQPQRRGGAEGF